MGRGHPSDEDGPVTKAAVSAFLDTNVLIRHLTGDPPEMAARATAYLRTETELMLSDVVAAESVYVLESFYEAPRDEVAQAMRSMVAFGSIICVDPALLLRAIEVYETDRVDFAEAYLVACAESTDVAKMLPSIGPSIVLVRSPASSHRLCDVTRAPPRDRPMATTDVA